MLTPEKLIIVKIWKQPKCPTLDEWMSIYTQNSIQLQKL